MRVAEDPARSRTWRRLLYAVFSLYALFGMADLGQGWLHSHHGWAGARRSLEARNYLKYGYIATGLKPLDNLGRLDAKDGLPEKEKLYWHHPPLVMVYLSLAYKLFGEGEIQAKLAFLLVSFTTFFLFAGFVRRASDERTAFTVMGLYTLMPIVATYINWVNFETMELFSMALMLYSLERWVEDGTRRWAAAMSLAAFVGIFADYPSLPFCFYFFLVLAFVTYRTELKQGSMRLADLVKGHPAFVFPLSVAVFFVLLVLLMASYKDSTDAFFHLARKRSAMGPSPFSRIMTTWNYYIDFFTPFAYGLLALYLLLLPIRAMKRRVGRLDAYLLVYLASALTFMIPLKQWLIPHEFGVLYMAPVLAMAAGMSLSGLAGLVGSSITSQVVVIGSVLTLTGVYSLPLIQSKHCSPMFDYVRPVYGSKGRARFHFQYKYKPLGEIVRRLSRPNERILVKGINWKPWAQYYFDREATAVKDPFSMHRKISSGRYSLVVMDLRNLAPGFHDPLLRDRPHVRYGPFAVVPLKHGRLKRTEYRVERVTDLPDAARYFASNVYSPFEVKTDPVRSFDYANKLGRKDFASYYAEGASDGDRLIWKIGLYNARKGSKKAALDLLKGPEKDLLGGRIKFLGSRVIVTPGGKSVVTAVFESRRRVAGHFDPTWRARSLADTPWLRSRIGAYKGRACFDVPTFRWKPGSLHWAEFSVEAPVEKYELSLSLTRVGGEFLRDPRTFSSAFKVDCRLVRSKEELDSAAREMESEPDTVTQPRDLGGRLLIDGCIIARSKGGTEGRILLTALEGIDEPYDIEVSCGKADSTSLLLSPSGGLKEGVSTTVKFFLDSCGAARMFSIRAVPSKRIRSTGWFVAARGEMGVRFPLGRLVKLDAFRWLAPWL